MNVQVLILRKLSWFLHQDESRMERVFGVMLPDTAAIVCAFNLLCPKNPWGWSWERENEGDIPLKSVFSWLTLMAPHSPQCIPLLSPWCSLPGRALFALSRADRADKLGAASDLTLRDCLPHHEAMKIPPVLPEVSSDRRWAVDC